VALFLREQGYRARALTGGIDAWRNAGLPLEAERNAETEVINTPATA
jgi:rhodanese-related sulfurtransferase